MATPQRGRRRSSRCASPSTVGTSYVFGGVFTLEFVLKVFALGPREYAADRLNLFDGFMVLMFAIETSLLGAGVTTNVFKAMRTFRLVSETNFALPWCLSLTATGDSFAQGAEQFIARGLLSHRLLTAARDAVSAQAQAVVAHAQAAHGVGRCAILDFDVHQGNGNAAMCWDDPTRLYASTHERGIFPCGVSAYAERPNPSVLNRPLSAGAGSAAGSAGVRARSCARAAEV